MDITRNEEESLDDLNFDDGLTENELAALKRSLKEVAMIKKGELKPLTMGGLWD